MYAPHANESRKNTFSVLYACYIRLLQHASAPNFKYYALNKI